MKYFLSLALSALLVSCATSHRETTHKIREMVMANKHAEAIALLNESELAKDEKSKFLFYLELGSLEHYRGNYAESTKALEAAKVIADDLYTVRTSNKIATAFTNDNADIYYGEKYEASMVHFYLALNHYMSGDLVKARSEILAWDTFLTDMKNERAGKALFKEDLLAKTFGAVVHEAQGNNKDDQVALQLYKDAITVFFKFYNMFPSYNAFYENFRKDYELLPKMSKVEIEKNYVLETEHTKSFREFLTLKILQLTQKIRPSDFKAQVALLKPSDDVLKMLKSKGGNITFLIQDGLIVEKIPRQYEFPINLGNNVGLAYMFGSGGKISYELPTVETPPRLEVARLQALDKAGTIVAESPLSVVSPVGELAEQAINEHSTSIAVKTGTRLAAKHIAAMVATQAVYQNAQARNDSMGMLLATAAHAVTIAGINESEKADTRFWSTLPSNIRMGHLPLPEGTYHFRAVYSKEGLADYRTVDLGEQTVTKSSLKFVMENKNLKYRSATNVAKTDGPVQVQPDSRDVAALQMPQSQQRPQHLKVAVTPTPAGGCFKDSDCVQQGTVCATVRGEYPGSCAATGLLGGMGRSVSGHNESKGCMKDSECSDGKICATVRGEYPGSCAQKAW